MPFAFAMPSLSSFLAPLHLLAYSTLLGTELYQSFAMTKIAHQSLPRSAFTTLQKRVFPFYFRSQSFLLILVAATLPPNGPVSVIKAKGDWIPMAVAGMTAALNLMIYGPRTKDIMIQRIHQETKDGHRLLDEGPISEEMKQLNRSFSRNHALSIHLNLLTIGATLFYGWRLASRLKFHTN